MIMSPTVVPGSTHEFQFRPGDRLPTSQPEKLTFFKDGDSRSEMNAAFQYLLEVYP